MKLSARNVLKGKVKSIVTGMVNSEIVIELPEGTEITSIITKTTAEILDTQLQNAGCSTEKLALNLQQIREPSYTIKLQKDRSVLTDITAYHYLALSN